MTYRSVSCTIIGFFVYLTLIVAINEALQCDKWKCPGPLIFYESLNCTPAYGKDDCCADYYNCDHLFNRIADTDQVPTKCYFDGREFQIGEELTDVLYACKKNCICNLMDDGMPDFVCENIHDCTIYISDGCYKERGLEEWGISPDQEFCPLEPREWGPTCVKSGKTYLEREFMLPHNKSKRICVCDPDEYRISCEWFSNWFDPHSAAQFYKGCVPVYALDRNGVIKIAKDSQEWRCRDIIYDDILDKNNTYAGSEISEEIHGPINQYACILRRHNFTTRKDCIRVNPQGPSGEIDDHLFRRTCLFGQLKMYAGDKLYSTRYDEHSCIVCTCEVPPTPTCVIKSKFRDKLCVFYNVLDKISACDKMGCPGPWSLYKVLKCLPVYKNTGDCCPHAYNCNHLYKIIEKKIKCYINGHMYQIGEKIREEDETHCKKDCICIKTADGLPDIYCHTDERLRCPSYTPFPLDNFPPNWCYFVKLLNKCCRTEVICSSNLNNRPKCEKFGISYFDGDYINFEHRPDAICKCRAYENGTSTILCTPINRWSDIHSVNMFYKGCAPVYIPYFYIDRWYAEVSRLIEVNRETWRCPRANDILFKSNHLKSNESKVEQQCNFGHWAMDIDDFLNYVTYNIDWCIVCICKIPPVPTCVLYKGTACHNENSGPTSLAIKLDDAKIINGSCIHNVPGRGRYCKISTLYRLRSSIDLNK